MELLKKLLWKQERIGPERSSVNLLTVACSSAPSLNWKNHLKRQSHLISSDECKQWTQTSCQDWAGLVKMQVEPEEMPEGKMNPPELQKPGIYLRKKIKLWWTWLKDLPFGRVVSLCLFFLSTKLLHSLYEKILHFSALK